MKRFVVASLIMLVAVLVPTTLALADSTAADCADGQWVVEPNQTLGFIAYTCGTTVSALVQANGLQNPNLINPGQVLIIPTGGQPNPPAPPPPAPGNPPAQPPAGSGAVTVTWGAPLYAGDGKVVEIPLTVTNNSVRPAVAGGRHPLGHGPGTPDGPYWVTLRSAVHAQIPYPDTDPGDLLWAATVTTDDGLTFPAYVGCHYLETVYAQGDEPLDRGKGIWFHWEVTLPGGWFDCGNSYQVKPPDLLPGQSGASVLTVYLVHPRDNVASSTRRVTHVNLEVFTTEGASLGIVSSQDFQ